MPSKQISRIHLILDFKLSDKPYCHMHKTVNNKETFAKVTPCRMFAVSGSIMPNLYFFK